MQAATIGAILRQDLGAPYWFTLICAMQTRFILINTSHAGNVGAAARAMKTMGFDDLVLVAPRWANVLRREETIQRASGALDVLEKCRIVDTLDEALDGMTHLCATAMTPRDFGPPTVTPREHFAVLSKSELLSACSTWARGRFDSKSRAAEPVPADGVGFLFGSERFGMRNEDVYRCHVCLSIPSNPQFGSLNIGAAIQVMAYEWRLALGGFAVPVARACRWAAGLDGSARAAAGRCRPGHRHADPPGAVAGGAGFSGPRRAQEADAPPQRPVQPRPGHAGGDPHPARHCQSHPAAVGKHLPRVRAWWRQTQAT